MDQKTPLSADEVRERLEALDGWQGGTAGIKRVYRFDSFLDAIAFIGRIAPHAEELDHHPELFNVYDRVEITLTTHDADGVTPLDFELAKKIDEVASL